VLSPRKIEYFLKVVDCGAFAKAAGELGVSQPTLSQQIAALEAHLERKLLVRSVHGVTVTEAGRAFYRHAQGLTKQFAQAADEVRRIVPAGGGPIALGLATCGAASTLALPILERVLAERADLRLRIFDNFLGSLGDSIMNGRIDLALAYGAGSTRGVRRQALFIEELFLLAPPGRAPAGDGPVDLATLRDVPLVMPSEVHYLRPVIEKACTGAGFRPRVVAEIDSFAGLVGALHNDAGVAILPCVALAAEDAARLAIRRIGPERIEATVSLCTSADLPVTASIEALAALITVLAQERLAAGDWVGVRAA
jgi:LysR family nitrogen assimilation transcriptional regulator